MNNQKIIEMHEKVYRDVKNYLEDKESNLAKRVYCILLRLLTLMFWNRISSRTYQVLCLRILANLAVL